MDKLTELFNQCRSAGYPYHPSDKNTRKKLLDQFFSYDLSKSNVVEDDVYIDSYLDNAPCKFNITNSGNSYLWSYFSEEQATTKTVHDGLTLLEAFNDDDILKKVLNRNVIELNKELTSADLRSWLKFSGRVRAITNFRPACATAIYDCLGDMADMLVWDPCAGFGGRMLGAIKSDKVKKYIATEPRVITFNKLNEIKDELKEYGYLDKYDKEIELYNETMEDVDLTKYEGYVDMIFTSPPYFNTERYSEEQTQSYIKYPNVNEWRDNFLVKLITKSYKMLRPGGKLILNVANVKDYTSLELDTLNIAIQTGFRLLAIHKYVLVDNKEPGQLRYEPIFELEKNI